MISPECLMAKGWTAGLEEEKEPLPVSTEIGTALASMATLTTMR